MEEDHNVSFIKRLSKLKMEEDEVQFQNGGSLLGMSSKSPSKLSKSKVLLIISLIALFVVTLAMLVLLFDRRHYSSTYSVTNTGQPTRRTITTSIPAEGFETPSVAMTTAQWESFRLPVSLKPTHYDLKLTTFVEENNFSGSVDITFRCVETTNLVILHKEDLHIHEDAIRLTNLGRREANRLQATPDYHMSYSLYIMHFQNFLTEGETYNLHLEFTGVFTPSLYGIYRSQYQTKSGPRYVVASFLSPLGARRVFPCFDEPAFKANFSVTINHPSSYKALSNMPEKLKRNINATWAETTFLTTPLMSTYLLSFAVTKFSSQAKVLPNGVELRVWSREEVIVNTTYAFEDAEKQFLFLEEYSGFHYPLPKLDMIALPELIPAGMENWGLMTLRERHLVVNTDTVSTVDVHESLFVIAHELSHQWYSNLVTQSFWDELWLKECFASLLGYLALDNVHPKWRTLEVQGFTENMLTTMKLDAMPTSHPILREITEPSHVLNNFDLVIYWKSTAVVRMLLGLIGETTFREGMAKFLQSRAYQNADSEDIWNALDGEVDHDQLGIHIADLMRPWLLQSCYPIVFVTSLPGERKVKVEQDVFLLDKDMRDQLASSPYNYRWDIPLTFVTASQEDWSSPQTYVMKRSVETVTDVSIENVNDDDWIIVNANRTGYYRVWYDQENRNRLIHQLEVDHEVIPPASRAALIDDAFILSMAGYLNYSELFRFTNYMSKERHHLPWTVLLSNFEYVKQMLSLTSAYGMLQEYMLQLIAPVFDAVVTNISTNVSDPERMLQSSIFGAACKYGYPPCLEKAKMEFDRYLENGISLHPNFEDSILSTAMIDSDGTTRAFNRLKEAKSLDQSSKWLVVLSSSPEPWVLSSVLELSLNSSVIKKTDAVELFSSTSGNPIGRYLTWNFFRSNWDTLRDRYGEGLFQMNQIIKHVTTWFNTEYQLQELTQFMETKEDDFKGAAGLSSLMSAIDNTKFNVRWMNSNYGNVKAFLEQNSQIGDQPLRL